MKKHPKHTLNASLELQKAPPKLQKAPLELQKDPPGRQNDAPGHQNGAPGHQKEAPELFLLCAKNISFHWLKRTRGDIELQKSSKMDD